MVDREAAAATIPSTMRAIRLRSPGLAGLTFEEVAIPRLGPGDALVRVHAAAITRDELDWPVDRLPATPSYELSGVVATVAPGVDAVAIGEGSLDAARELGANEVVDGSTERWAEALGPVDLVFDTVGGALLKRSPAVVRQGGRLISVATEPPETPSEARINSAYFVVEPKREALVEIARLIDDGRLRPAVDSVFPLTEARAAFEQSMAPGKRGKVVIGVANG